MRQMYYISGSLTLWRDGTVPKEHLRYGFTLYYEKAIRANFSYHAHHMWILLVSMLNKLEYFSFCMCILVMSNFI